MTILRQDFGAVELTENFIRVSADYIISQPLPFKFSRAKLAKLKEVILMIRGLDGVLLSSANSKKLADFYKDVVGLKCTGEWEMGEEGESGYEFADVNLFINYHSEVKGKAKEPQRYMLNLEVNDLEEEAKRMKKEKVKVIQDVYHIEGYGLVATFEDVDGNYFQLVQVRASSKES